MESAQGLPAGARWKNRKNVLASANEIQANLLLITKRFHIQEMFNCIVFSNFDQPRPQGFSLKKWVGREKALASAGHVQSLNIPEKLIYMQHAGFALTEGSNNGK